MYQTPQKLNQQADHQQSSSGSDTISFVNTRDKRKRSEKMLTDLSDFKKELKDMLSSWMFQQDSERVQIRTSLKTIEDSLSFLSSQYEEMKKRMEELEGENKKSKEYIYILEDKIETLQKVQNKCSLEIKNVPKQNDESKSTLINMVCQLSSSLKVDVKSQDIKDVYRASSKGDKKPIVVELTSYIQKSNLMQAVKRHNAQNKNNKLNTYQLGLKCNTIPIFVSEHLTQKGNRLFYLARELSKTLKFKFCWTSLGEVFVRKDENSPIIKIISECQIKSLYESAK